MFYFKVILFVLEIKGQRGTKYFCLHSFNMPSTYVFKIKLLAKLGRDTQFIRAYRN